MPREGVDLYKDIGSSPEELRRAIQQLRLEFETLRYYDFLRVQSLTASNVAIAAGSADNPIGNIGKDPKSANIWGFIAERGYGFHVRYLGANYGRLFVDAGNDPNHGTPSMILDMPSPNKLVIKDNENATIARFYGRHGREVGFSSNYFDGYGSFDLFCPMRLFTYDYAGGTAGGPEGRSGYAQQGFMYYRQNYGSGKLSDLRIFDKDAWRSVQTFHPEATAGNPFAAETVAVRESVTVSIG